MNVSYAEYKRWKADQMLQDRKRKAMERMQEEQHIEDANCKHRGFVGRDLHGEYRYICYECKERFKRHPRVVPTIKVDPIHNRIARQAISDFREGMLTFTDAIRKAQCSVEEFNDAMKTLFPPKRIRETIMHHSLRGESEEVVTRDEPGPARKSCPKEVEDYFRDPNTTLSDVRNSIFDRFPDITQVSHNEQGDAMIVDLDFVDGSTQKVVMDNVWGRV